MAKLKSVQWGSCLDFSETEAALDTLGGLHPTGGGKLGGEKSKTEVLCWTLMVDFVQPVEGNQWSRLWEFIGHRSNVKNQQENPTVHCW